MRSSTRSPCQDVQGRLSREHAVQGQQVRQAHGGGGQEGAQRAREDQHQDARHEAGRKLDADNKDDNWNVFESISQEYIEAKDGATQFEALRARAQERLRGTMSTGQVERGDAVYALRDELVAELEELGNFTAQAHIVSKTVDIVSSFIKDPRLFRIKLMNFMMVGSAGTGKTTIAAHIGNVFAKAGMFVGNNLVEAGRADLVGQYEGQTVARTRNFLLSNLDNGVIFVDEAYSITPWQNGKPEGYGSEAATAMVEFMTRYKGLYCIITAGYEKEMTRYFLATNEGLDRRFPYKFILRDMSPGELVRAPSSSSF